MALFNMISADDPAGITLAYPSPVRVHMPGYERAEDDLHAAYDGETPLVAVECWDHVLADGERGAWLVGERTAVMAQIEANGWEEWEIQYELYPPDFFDC